MDDQPVHLFIDEATLKLREFISEPVITLTYTDTVWITEAQKMLSNG